MRPKPPANPWLGWPTALFATIAFSIGPTITKVALGLGLNTNLILSVRFVLSTLVLGVMAVALAGPQGLSLPRRGLLIAVGVGLLNGFSMLAFFWSLTRINASIGSMIFSVYPIVLMGLLRLRGERFSRRQYLRLVLGLAGVYLLIGPGGMVDGWGVILVFIAVVISALTTALMQWYLQPYAAQAVTFYTVAGITVTVLVFWAWQGIEWQDPGWQGWLIFITLAVINTALSRLAWFVANKRLGGGQMALLVPFETFFTVIWSVIFLHEQLTFQQWLGGSLILLSMILAVQGVRRRRWRSPQMEA